MDGANAKDSQALHRVVFEVVGAAKYSKRNLIQFGGFDFLAESEEFDAVVKTIMDVRPVNLEYLCWLSGDVGKTNLYHFVQASQGKKICNNIIWWFNYSSQRRDIGVGTAAGEGKAVCGDWGTTILTTWTVDKTGISTKQKTIKIYEIKEKKTGSVRGSDKVSSWLNENELDKQHGIVQEQVEQQHEYFEDINLYIKLYINQKLVKTPSQNTKWPDIQTFDQTSFRIQAPQMCRWCKRVASFHHNIQLDNKRLWFLNKREHGTTEEMFSWIWTRMCTNNFVDKWCGTGCKNFEEELWKLWNHPSTAKMLRTRRHSKNFPIWWRTCQQLLKI
jgi:hypothetical protein